MKKEKSNNKKENDKFYDSTGSIRTFTIIIPDNPLDYKNITKEIFQERFIKWSNNKKIFNKETINRFKISYLKSIILKTGKTSLAYTGAYYTLIDYFCKKSESENSYVVFNISFNDAKALANNYGQLSFFFVRVGKDDSSIEYYRTLNSCITYRLVEKIESIKSLKEASQFFLKYNYKWDHSLNEFKDRIPKVIDKEAFEYSFDDINGTFMYRASKRRKSDGRR